VNVLSSARKRAERNFQSLCMCTDYADTEECELCQAIGNHASMRMHSRTVFGKATPNDPAVFLRRNFDNPLDKPRHAHEVFSNVDLTLNSDTGLDLELRVGL
jgi:hypothetical protein